MIRITGLFTIFILSCGLALGQEYKAEFDKFLKSGDTSKQIEILTKWESESPKSPELFTSYFNYYFLKSKQPMLNLTNKPPNGESFSIQDSSGNTVGFIGDGKYFEPKTLQKGFDKIDEGIKLYPNRLDMRFGKVYALGEVEDWQKFTDEIVKTVRYSKQNNNLWTWTFGEKRENGKKFLLSSIQTYQLQLYNTGNDELLVNMRTIADEVLKIYPDHIESLSNLSITYLLTGEYDKGIKPLLRAEKLAPKDPIILANIAQGYKLKGDFEMAIKYYKKVIEHGDDRSVEYAKKQIEELKK